MNSERFRELAIGHLLAELQGSEEREFQEELDRRASEGRRELERLREAIGSLALGATPAEPPSELRARLLSEVRGDAVDATSDSEHQATTSGDKPGVSGDEPAVSGDEPAVSGDELSAVVRLRPLLGRWGVAAAGIAAALAFVLGLGNVELRNRVTRLTASLDSARSALVAADARVASADSLRESLKESESAIGIAAARGAGTVLLSGTEIEPLAWARAFMDPATGRALLLVFDLPVLAPDTVYQLWAIRGGAPQPAGTLQVVEDGTGRLESDEGDLWIGADVLAVTVEPAPGQPAPTGPIVLAGSL